MLSQEDLAQMADLRIDTLRAIEQGRRADPSFFRVVRVIRTLELTTEKFLAKHGLSMSERPPRSKRP